jgi:hypothetical protein
MSWRANDFTAIHNHGATEWGCVFFMGSATHRIYEMENDKLSLNAKMFSRPAKLPMYAAILSILWEMQAPAIL